MSIFKWLSYSLLLVLFCNACGKPLPTLDNIDTQAWKDDKLGCAGKRSAMISDMEREAEKLLALSQQDIVGLLGKPDENELYKRNQKFFYYFVQPSKSCSDTVSVAPRKLVIRFNAMGLAKEIAME